MINFRVIPCVFLIPRKSPGKRFFHASSCRYNTQSVRVRFAPSPTGYLHLGGLRTALYNFLFAKKLNGSFILRIEDTDQSRLVPGAAKQLEEDLKWAGLIPDESPILGGNFGPYVQSQRLVLYQEHVNRLIEEGKAYRCFCTDHRLNVLKNAAMKAGEVPRYDNRCRSLSKEQIEQKLQEGRPHCVRFKLEPFPEPFHDLVYGPITYDVHKHEGDPVILKQDGYPTYHLACVIDDHLMKISHVLRGVEWQISTPKHILLYKAFEWEPPKFAHLPLIMNQDGTKLSKRQDDIRLETFRRNRNFPEAILNLVASVGGGFDPPIVTNELYPMEELIQRFDITHLGTNSCKLNMVLAADFGRFALQKRFDKEREFLVKDLQAIVGEKLSQNLSTTADEVFTRLTSFDYLNKILAWGIVDRVSNLRDFIDPKLEFLWSVPSSDSLLATFREIKVNSSEVVEVIAKWLEDLEESNYHKKALFDTLKQLCKENGLKLVTVAKMLRGILSGLKDGPPVAEMLEILGRKETLYRLNYARKLLKHGKEQSSRSVE